MRAESPDGSCCRRRTSLRSGATGSGVDDGRAIRSIAGQVMTPSTEAGHPAALDPDDGALIHSAARTLAGQTLFGRPQAVHRPAARRSKPVADDGYQIGEEHPEVHASDALFEARQALELGALELTLGRLTSQQLAGYRLLAESTMPYVQDDHFVDAAQYTETNAAFHDYLFTLTGNDHLLQGVSSSRRQGPHERGAAQCDVVPSAVRAGPPGHRQRHRGGRSRRGPRADLRARGSLQADDAPRHGRRGRQHASRGSSRPGRFAGKVVVVTGAAQGIGEQTARRINAEGGTLVLADRSELVKELADELSAHGGGALAVTADLEHWEGADSLFQQALSAFGRIDVLINNVGGAINFKPFTQFTDAEIRAEIDRSLMTTLYACRAALPSMVERGRGRHRQRVIGRDEGDSPHSLLGGQGRHQRHHRIVGHGVRRRRDPGGRHRAGRHRGACRDGSRAGTPEPRTDTERAWFDAHIDQTIGSSLMKRYGTLDEQAAAICFLASDEASYITGSVLPVAGGDAG